MANVTQRFGVNVRTALRWLSAEQGSLKHQAARGWVWVFLGEGLSRLTSLLKLSILGRLLSPQDYGVFGVAALLLQWLSYFSQTGLDAALIQKRGGIEPYLNAYWTSQVIRGLSLAALLFVGAPVGAAFFHSPEAVPIIRLFGIGACIYGLRNPGVVYLRKDLYFKKDVVWRFLGAGAGLLVAIPLAVLFRNVWALAYSAVAADLAEVAASYWIHPYRPRFCLNWGRLRELTGFSKWIVTSNVLGFLQQYMDSLAVGKFLGAGALGLYQVGGQIALMPTAQLGAQMRAVLFPAFSKIHDIQRLRRAFFRALGILFTLIVPAACFLTVFAEPVVRIVLGSKWVAVSPFLRVLVWGGVMKGFAGLATALSLAAGRPRLAVQASLVDIGLFAIFCYPLISRLSLWGAALVIVISSSMMALYYISVTRRVIEFDFRDLIRCVRPACLAALPFLVVAPFVDATISSKSLVVAALALCVSAVLVFSAARSQFRGDVPPDTLQTPSATEEIMTA